jgi:hypothetical protein
MRTISLFFLCLLALQVSGQTVFSVHPNSYFTSDASDVFVFSDIYPEGKQGGIELIHHGMRIGSNGDLRVNPTPEQWDGLPKSQPPVWDAAARRVVTRSAFGDSLGYEVALRAEGDGLVIDLRLDQPVPARLAGVLSFNMEFLPSAFFGKAFILDQTYGLLPRQPNGPMRKLNGKWEAAPLATGKHLTLAPGDKALEVRISSEDTPLELLDGRHLAQNGWLVVRSALKEGQQTLTWRLTPAPDPGWRRPPVMLHSQVGYHPSQAKKIFIECDPRGTHPGAVSLETVDGKPVMALAPAFWGKFLRYDYYLADFSSVTTEGMYRLRLGSQLSTPFQIGRAVYDKDVWQPTLHGFFAVQMCHAEVREAYKIWHGTCHLDDGIQAPLNHSHFDGYVSGSQTHSPFQPGDHMPGMNTGGWHDAGDDDLAAGSQSATVYSLILSHEAFSPQWDNTDIRLKERKVEIHRPDGKNDVLQQIENGVLNLLTGYRIAGHSFTGIITNTIRDYVTVGDWASMSNNVDESGLKADDRWVFTDRSSALEYRMAAVLAASSRALKGFNDTLARECLATARKVWEYEQSHDPVTHRSAYVPGNLEQERLLAAVELFATTGEGKYRSWLLKEAPAVMKKQHEGVLWALVRVEDQLKDKAFSQALATELAAYSGEVKEMIKGNPFGVPFRPQIWGLAWGLQSFALKVYYLSAKYPAMFDKELVFSVVNYVLGVHPGSNVSLTSGVGAHSMTSAYGINRADFAYIPGGMVSGTGLIRPDYPELMENWPFLWQQNEYVMPGAADYIFCILAASHLSR